MDFGGFVSLIIIYWALMLVLTIFAAGKMKTLVYDKGYDAKELHIFAWCFWFPIFGYLYAIALPDLTLQKQNKEIIEVLKTMSSNSSDFESPDKSQNLSTSNSRLNLTSLSQNNQSSSRIWICENCGEKNSTSQSICKGCGKYK